MPIYEFCEFVVKAREIEKDERIFKEWCAFVPRFSDTKYLDYEYFKAIRIGSNIDTRPVDVIIAEIDKAHQKG